MHKHGLPNEVVGELIDALEEMRKVAHKLLIFENDGIKLSHHGFSGEVDLKLLLQRCGVRDALDRAESCLMDCLESSLGALATEALETPGREDGEP